MGAIQDRLPDPDIAALLTEFKKYAKIDPLDTSDDFMLQLSLEGAMEQADLFINNPFVDGFGVDESIPSSVKLGVFVFAIQDAVRADPSISSKRSSRIAETYRSTEEALKAVEDRYWCRYRKIPGL